MNTNDMKDELLNEITHEIEHSDSNQLKHSISHFKQFYLNPMPLENDCFKTPCITCEYKCVCTIITNIYEMLIIENYRRNKIKYKTPKYALEKINKTLTDSSIKQTNIALNYFDDLLMYHTPNGFECWTKDCTQCDYKRTCSILITIISLIRSF